MRALSLYKHQKSTAGFLPSNFVPKGGSSPSMETLDGGMGEILGQEREKGTRKRKNCTFGGASGTGAKRKQFVLSNQSTSFEVCSPKPHGCTERHTHGHHLLGISLRLKGSVVVSGFREVVGGCAACLASWFLQLLLSHKITWCWIET